MYIIIQLYLLLKKRIFKVKLKKCCIIILFSIQEVKSYNFIMKFIENNSYLSIRKHFSLSKSDEEVLSFLYLPIIKGNAYSLYLSLYNYSHLNSISYDLFHDEIFSLLGFSMTDFNLARMNLEGIGLLEVLRKEDMETKNISYIYNLLPPASPKKFFNDILLRTAFSEIVGKKRYFLLYNYFQIEKKDIPEDYVNVTTPFKDVFSINIPEDDDSLKPVNENFVDKVYKTQCQFDRKSLKKKLKENQFDFMWIKNDIKEIENIANLYEIKLDDVCDLIIKNTDSDNIFYLESFKKDARSFHNFKSDREYSANDVIVSDNGYMKIIQKFNSVTPQEYLSIYFNANPTSFMLKVIEDMTNNLHFSNPIINVVLDYCLRKTKGEFNSTYIQKVAFTLSSLDVKSAYDAMTKLNSRDFEAHKKSKKEKSKNKEPISENDSLEEVEKKNIEDLAKEFGL